MLYERFKLCASYKSNNDIEKKDFSIDYVSYITAPTRFDFAGEKLDVLVNIHKQVIITQAQYRLRK